MPVMLILLVFPFILFLGGAYVLNYPLSVGMLYALNMSLIYIVLWFLVNQIVKVQTQRMKVSGGLLLLSRKQLFLSPPVLRRLDLEVPLEQIKKISLSPTRVGYLLTVRFRENDKTMGVDLDINPLRVENKTALADVLRQFPGIEFDRESRRILEEFENKMLAWRGTYVSSLFVLALALVVFFAVGVYLGAAT